ncbi:hypothetical protein WA026_000782 [Henosepilachna vigintioctopunctata]|uniref:Uncharacterized protein n=1 Tax=Henosepilachna vigintioctopunctata TaxID=420089 RepID=A0AAW1UYQ5_9CUCU
MIVGETKSDGFIIVLESIPVIEYFLADHPFLFVLKCGPTVMFEGKCLQPVSGDDIVAPIGKPVEDPHS